MQSSQLPLIVFALSVTLQNLQSNGDGDEPRDRVSLSDEQRQHLTDLLKVKSLAELENVIEEVVAAGAAFESGTPTASELAASLGKTAYSQLIDFRARLEQLLLSVEKAAKAIAAEKADSTVSADNALAGLGLSFDHPKDMLELVTHPAFPAEVMSGLYGFLRSAAILKLVRLAAVRGEHLPEETATGLMALASAGLTKAVETWGRMDNDRDDWFGDLLLRTNAHRKRVREIAADLAPEERRALTPDMLKA